MYNFYIKYLWQPPRSIAKLLLIMRLTTLLLITAILQVSAGSFAQNITLSEKNAPLVKVFDQIRIQTGYDFMFTATTLKDAKQVTIDVKNAALNDVLKKIFEGQPLDYSIDAKTVVISKKGKTFVDKVSDVIQSLSKDNIDIQGTVLDENEQPLPGATVKVKGTSISAVTDANGVFKLIGLKENAQLIISFIGYKPKEISINKSGQIAIKMEVLSSELATVDIVNTGYQTLSKERSAGSFAKPDMNIVENRTGSMNILQRLDGLVPGLVVNNSPSSSQNPFLIRGLTTIGVENQGTPGNTNNYGGTNRNPLFVVDGIPLDDVSSVNPQDVADITVLKDATAASIWGSRAANGVIVITTKKGTKGDKLKINYDAFVNFQGKPDLNYMPVLSSQQFIQAAREVFNLQDENNPQRYAEFNPWNKITSYTGTANTGVPPHEVILYNQYRGIITAAQANASLDSLAAINNVQQIKDLWYRNASLMNHTVSLSGGGDRYAFYGSAAYTNAQSNRPGEKNDTYKVNLRQDFSLGKRIQLNLITDLTNNISSAQRNINVDNRFLPYQLFQDANGNNLSIPYMRYLSDSLRVDYQNRSRINLDYVPLDEVNYGNTKGDGLISRVIGGLTVDLFKGLKFQGTYGYIKNSNRTTSYDDSKSYLVRSEIPQFTIAATPSVTPDYHLPTTGGRYSVTNLSQRNLTIRNQLVYDKDWNNSTHQLTLLAGQESQDQLANTNGSTERGYNPLLQTYGLIDYDLLNTDGISGVIMPNNGSKSTLINDLFRESEIQTRFVSYYANGSYTYKRKYSLNGSWRIDKSNLFGVDKSAQNQPVWSIGGKWLVTEEAFMHDISWLNRFALRGTYGITGNAPLPGTASSYDVLIAQSNGLFTGGTGLDVSTPGNPKLTWESTKTINVGLDFSLLKERLNGSVDLYQKKTKDLLGDVPTNSLSGYPSITGNLGKMENKGIELSLNSVNIRNNDFNWSTQLIMSYNKNIITQLNSLTPITTGLQRIQQRYQTGYPAFAVFAYQYAGLDNMGDPQIKLADGTITKAPNISKPDDIKYMGTYQPVWSGGLSNLFNYKSFGLNVNVIYNFGNVMRRDVNQFYKGRLIQNNMATGGFTTGNLNADFANRWMEPGDEAFTNIPSYVVSNSISDSRRDVGYYEYADINVVSASYVKLRDITLSYSLPRIYVSRLKADNISFRVQLSNLMLWKANKDGIDPEFQDAFTGIRTIRSNQETISLGVNVKF